MPPRRSGMHNKLPRVIQSGQVWFWTGIAAFIKHLVNKTENAWVLWRQSTNSSNSITPMLQRGNNNNFLFRVKLTAEMSFFSEYWMLKPKASNIVYPKYLTVCLKIQIYHCDWYDYLLLALTIFFKFLNLTCCIKFNLISCIEYDPTRVLNHILAIG